MCGQIKEIVSVYPGQYKPPAFDINEIEEVLHSGGEGASQPVANIIECGDHYKIEIVAPGHTKGDFIINTDKGRLNIFAVRRKPQLKDQPLYHAHEFNFDFFEHSILLPENIDTDFVRAEYKAGIINICFQKTGKPVSNTFHQIIVY